MPDTFRKILGVRFYISDIDGLMEIVPEAGLIVVPSAPVMTRLTEDDAHREAMEGADFAITDSAFMVLLWLLATGERIRRISGLRLLRAIVDSGLFTAPGESFWVMPSKEDSEANVSWLRTQGFGVTDADAYVAPLYPRSGRVSDSVLIDLIAARRPKLVVIALSGGVQERLGWELSRRVGYRPTILCIGGAIAFLSGRQNSIPVWADRLALGWLLRFIASPRPFAAKVRGVEKLVLLIRRFGSGSVSPKS